MVRRKCPSCAEKIERKFRFCPYCGESFVARAKEQNYGFLGLDDSEEIQRKEPELRLPFGLNKMVDSLVKQLEKQMGNMNFEEEMVKGMPKGFKIKISTGMPGQPQVLQKPQKPRVMPEQIQVSEEEMRKRNKLPKKEAETKIRRLADKIIYEIAVPGVRLKQNVILNELATGLEVRAYSKDTCYTKYIPIQVELLHYYVDGEKLYLECKT